MRIKKISPIAESQISTRNERQEKFQKFKNDAISKGYEIKCISDEIYLYARYIVGQCIERHYRIQPQDHNWDMEPVKVDPIRRDIGLSLARNQVNKTLDKWYYRYVRGNERFSGKPPSSVAAGLAYVALLVNHTAATQRDISEITGVSIAAVAHNWQVIKSLYDKDQTVFRDWSVRYK